MSKKHKRNKKEWVSLILNSSVTRDGTKFSKESEDDLFQSDDIDEADYDTDYEFMFDDSEDDLEIDDEALGLEFDDLDDDDLFEENDLAVDDEYDDSDDDLDLSCDNDFGGIFDDVDFAPDDVGENSGNGSTVVFDTSFALDCAELSDIIHGKGGLDLFNLESLDILGRKLTEKIKKSIKKRCKYEKDHPQGIFDVQYKYNKTDKLINSLKGLIRFRELNFFVSKGIKNNTIKGVLDAADISSRQLRLNSYVDGITEGDLVSCDFNFDYITARLDMLRRRRVFTSDDLQFILRDTSRVLSLSNISAETTYGTSKMNSKAYILIRTEDGIKEIYISQLLDLIGELSVLAKSDSFDSFCQKLEVSRESEVYTSLMHRSSDIFNLVYMLSEVYGSSCDNKISYVMDRLEEMDLITLCYMLLILSRGYATEICLISFISFRRYMEGFERTGLDML